MLQKQNYSYSSLKEELLLLCKEKESFSVGLIGDLGSGKTHFVSDLLRSFDSALADEVTSPTFSLQHVYQTESKLFYHFDLYRIEEYSELENIGLFDALMSQSITFIEWINLFPSLESDCDILIKIEMNAKEERTYQVL